LSVDRDEILKKKKELDKKIKERALKWGAIAGTLGGGINMVSGAGPGATLKGTALTGLAVANLVGGLGSLSSVKGESTSNDAKRGAVGLGMASLTGSALREIAYGNNAGIEGAGSRAFESALIGAALGAIANKWRNRKKD